MRTFEPGLGKRRSSWTLSDGVNLTGLSASSPSVNPNYDPIEVTYLLTRVTDLLQSRIRPGALSDSSSSG